MNFRQYDAARMSAYDTGRRAASSPQIILDVCDHLLTGIAASDGPHRAAAVRLKEGMRRALIEYEREALDEPAREAA